MTIALPSSSRADLKVALHPNRRLGLHHNHPCPGHTLKYPGHTQAIRVKDGKPTKRTGQTGASRYLEGDHEANVTVIFSFDSAQQR